MIIGEGAGRDLTALVVPGVGKLVETAGVSTEPYRLVDAAGASVEPVGVFFRELLASGRSVATVRSYGMDLLRWWRFLAAVDVGWDRASRIEARDFSCWIQSTAKPRRTKTGAAVSTTAAGAANAVTGKSSPGSQYAVTTVAHCETVLRTFYEFHLEAGTGPIINPFPLDRSRRSGRANAHHNPMTEFRRDRVGRYRPRSHGASPAESQMRGSTRSSRRWARIGIERWSRSGFPAGSAPRNCWECGWPTSTLDSR